MRELRKRRRGKSTGLPFYGKITAWARYQIAAVERTAGYPATLGDQRPRRQAGEIRPDPADCGRFRR
jgi:hypothetical protein